MTDDPLLVSVDGGVATLRLNRPERRNALNPLLRSRIAAELSTLEGDDSVRVVVLTGAGTAFCAGVDLKDAAAPTGHVINAESVSAPLQRFRKPVIAAINGAAVGGGLELALAADILIASRAGSFALTEARIGSMPGAGGTQRLPLLVGRAVAMRMLLTGRAIDAAEALRVGLISDLVEPDELDGAATALAAEVAACAPLSLIAIKEAVRAGAPEQGLTAGLALERSLWALLAGTEDRAEGRAAFREKRPPRFTAR